MTRQPVTPEQLRHLAEAIERLEPSAALGQRLRASFDGRPRPPKGSSRPPKGSSRPPKGSSRRLEWAAVGVLMVGVVLGGLLVPWLWSPALPPSERLAGAGAGTIESPPSSDDLEVRSPGCSLEVLDGERQRIPAGCRVRVPAIGLGLDAWSPTTVRRTAAGLAMGEGLAAFAVEHVEAGRPPVEIEAGAATVRVIGTRFVIARQGDGAGHLDLIEGRVELLHGAEVFAVEEGRRSSWTRASVQVPARGEPASAGRAPAEPPAVALDPEQAAPGGERRPSPGASGPGHPDASGRLADVLAEVARLRRQRKYDKALDRLQSLGRGGWDRSTRAVLSYERGTLLEASGRVRDACAHWARHRKRHAGRGPSDVEARRARLGCDDG